MKLRLKAPVEHMVKILRCIDGHGAQMLTAKGIAEEVGLTPSYVMRLTSQMKKAGLLKAVQGRYGGFSLSMPPSEISLLQVFLAMEGSGFDSGMIDGLKGSDQEEEEKDGPFDEALLQLGAVMETHLEKIRLSDLK